MRLFKKEKLIGHAFGVPLGVAFMCALMCQNVKSFASVQNEVAVHIIAEPPVVIPHEVQKPNPKTRAKPTENKMPKYHPTKQKLMLATNNIASMEISIETPKPIENATQSIENIKIVETFEDVKPKPATTQHLGGELAIYCPTRPPPEYPSASRELGEEGVVSLKVTINNTGNIESAVITQSSKFQRLDNAALKAVRKWHCKSPFLADANTKAVALQEFEFGFNH
jgi:protein TonB